MHKLTIMVEPSIMTYLSEFQEVLPSKTKQNSTQLFYNALIWTVDSFSFLHVYK